VPDLRHAVALHVAALTAETTQQAESDVSPALENEVLAPDAAVPEGIESLFSQYAADVAAVGLAMLGGNDEAQDLVQDVFLRAWRGLDKLKSPESVKPWLMTIAVRAARTRLRRRRLRQIFFGADHPDFEKVAATGATAEDKLMLQRLFEVLETMPLNLRTPWVLRHIQTEKVEEIAKICGWSLSTTKRRLQEAQQFVARGIG